MKPSPVRAIAARLSLQRSRVRVGTAGSTGLTLPRPTAGDREPQWGVGINEDCRHYVMQSTAGGEKLQRCKIGANEPLPFACPVGCVFYEPRRVSQAGWQVPRTGDEAVPPD